MEIKLIIQGISLLLTVIGFAVLGGKHIQSVKFQAIQRDEDVRNQNEINKATTAKIDKQDSKLSKTVREIYARLHKDDQRREDREDVSRKDRTTREDSFRKDLAASMDKITDRLDESNKLYSAVLIKLGEK